MRSLAFVLLLVPSPAFAGWTALQVSGAAQGQSSEAQLYYDGGKLRIDSGKKSYVLEFKTDRFLFIDHEKKTYASATLDEVINLQKQILEMMKKNVSQLPPPQRQMAEAQLEKVEKGMKAKTLPDVKKTGKRETVNGYSCELVTWADDFGANEACLAENMPADVKSFTAESAQLSKRMAEKGASSATPSQALFQLPGFPVRTKRTEKMGPTEMVSTTEIKDVKNFKANADTFVAPKTYQKTTLQSIVAPGI